MARTVDLPAVQPPATTDAAASGVCGGHACLADVERRLTPYVERAEPRQRALAYPRGLLRSVERKNSRQLAEVRGDVSP